MCLAPQHGKRFRVVVANARPDGKGRRRREFYSILPWRRSRELHSMCLAPQHGKRFRVAVVNARPDGEWRRKTEFTQFFHGAEVESFPQCLAPQPASTSVWLS